MNEVERFSLGVAALAACVWPLAARGEDGAAVATVQVRGLRRATRAPREPMAASAVLSGEEIAAPGLRVAEALRGQLGLQVTETGGAGTPALVSIRGATASETPVYLAGVRLNDDVTGAADLSRIPLWLLDRIEVYRSSAPMEADRWGIGGAIFFEPRTPTGPELGGAASLGSFGGRGARAFGAAGDQDRAVLAGVSTEAAQNDYPFTNDHGTLLAPTGTTRTRMTNADVTTHDAWALTHVQSGAAAIDAFANGMLRDQGVPTLALVPSRESRASYERVLAGARATLSIDPERDASLQASTSLSGTRAIYSDPLEELGLGARRIALSGSRAAERLALAASPTGGLTVRAAVDLESERLVRDQDSREALRAERLSLRASAAAKQTIAWGLGGQLLGAIECQATGLSTVSVCDRAAPVGRVSLGWAGPLWEAFANAGIYDRVPTLGELYGMSVSVQGNGALRPETGTSLDFGARFAAPFTMASARAPWGTVAVFVRSAKDEIAFVRTSEGFAEPINIGRARVAGAELQVGTGVLPGVDVDVSATALDPRDVTPGRLVQNSVLPFESRLVVAPRASAEARELRLAWLGRLRAEIRWVYQSSRYADAAGLGVIPEQSSLDAEVLAETQGAHFTLRLRGADLLDAQRFDLVGFPLPGRSFFVALEAK